MTRPDRRRTGARALVDQLLIHGVERAVYGRSRGKLISAVAQDAKLHTAVGGAREVST